LYLAERYYRERQSSLGELNEKLRQEFIESTFGDITTTQTLRKVASPWNVSEVKKRKETIVGGLANAGIKVPEESVSKYFRSLEKIAGALEKKGINREKPSPELFDWLINMPQIQKVERLIKRMEEYNNQRNILFGRVEAFRDTVNSFLCDTDKQIEYDTSGELIVKVGKDLEIRPDSLSSGEIQLLTLFSYLYFGVEKTREFVVMIDEPELSLHLQWQHKYVESVMKANPNAQFIFATHAPEIGQGYDDYCIELSPQV
jgi:predicted ATP-binding protein involved in virulence